MVGHVLFVAGPQCILMDLAERGVHRRMVQIHGLGSPLLQLLV